MIFAIDCYANSTDLDSILNQSCKNQNRSNLADKYLKEGNFDSDLKNAGGRIWQLDLLHKDVKSSIGDSNNDFECIDALYNKGLEDAASYWLQRGLNEGCLIQGQEIPSTKPPVCPASTWEEFSNSMNYHSNLERDYRSFVTDVKKQTNTPQENICSQNKDQNQVAITDIRFASCCQVLQDGGFVEKGIDDLEKSNSCHSLMDGERKELDSIHKVGRCGVNVGEGAFTALYDLIKSIPELAKLLINGDLGRALGSEYLEYTSNPSAYYNKLVNALELKFESVLACMSPQERQDFLCKNIPYAITLVIPTRVAGLLAQGAAKSSKLLMPTIHKTVATTAKSFTSTLASSKIAKPFSAAKTVLQTRIEVADNYKAFKDMLSEKLNIKKSPKSSEIKPIDEKIAAAKSSDVKPEAANEVPTTTKPHNGETASVAKKESLADNEGSAQNPKVRENISENKTSTDSKNNSSARKSELQTTETAAKDVALERTALDRDLENLIEDLKNETSVSAGLAKKASTPIEGGSKNSAKLSRQRAKPQSQSPKILAAQHTVENVISRLEKTDLNTRGKHFEMQKIFGDKNLSSRRIADTAKQYHQAVETIRRDGQISGSKARDLHDSISIAESYATGSNKISHYPTSMFTHTEVQTSSSRIKAFKARQNQGAQAMHNSDGREYLKAFGNVNGDLKNTRRVSSAAKQHHKDIDVLRENGNITDFEARNLHEDVETIEYLATGRNSRNIASVLNSPIEEGSFIQLVEDIPVSEADIERGLMELSDLEKLNTKNAQTFYHKFKTWSLTFLSNGRIIVAKGKQLYEVTSDKIKDSLAKWKVAHALRNTISYAKDQNFVNNLRKNDLLPKFTVVVQGVNYHLSDIINIKNGRKVVFAIIENGKKRIFQTLASSNSQGTFRVIPMILQDQAISSASIEVPNEVEAFLGNKLLKNEVRTDISKTAATSLLISSVPDNLITKKDEQHPLFNEFGNLKSKPLLSDRDGHILENADKGIRPENIRIANRDWEPDFTIKPVLKYKTSTNLAGEVEAQVFRSRNQQIEFTVLKDKAGKIWFAKIVDVKSPINNAGLRREFFTAKSLLKPRWEYGTEIPIQYAGEPNRNDKNYLDEWNYLKRIPVIQDYYVQQGLPIPN
jgi:hypothetical protein